MQMFVSVMLDPAYPGNYLIACLPSGHEIITVYHILKLKASHTMPPSHFSLVFHNTRPVSALRVIQPRLTNRLRAVVAYLRSFLATNSSAVNVSTCTTPR